METQSVLAIIMLFLAVAFVALRQAILSEEMTKSYVKMSETAVIIALFISGVWTFLLMFEGFMTNDFEQAEQADTTGVQEETIEIAKLTDGLYDTEILNKYSILDDGLIHNEIEGAVRADMQSVMLDNQAMWYFPDCVIMLADLDYNGLPELITVDKDYKYKMYAYDNNKHTLIYLGFFEGDSEGTLKAYYDKLNNKNVWIYESDETVHIIHTDKIETLRDKTIKISPTIFMEQSIVLRNQYEIINYAKPVVKTHKLDEKINLVKVFDIIMQEYYA